MQAELTYIVRQDTKPYFESSALTGGAPRVHFQTEQHSVPVEDMRTLSPPAGLDREGFELTRHRSAVTDLYDDDAIERTYNVELEVFLKAFTGADRVAIFDHTRRSDAPEGARNPDGLRGPANRVHVDYTVKSGPQRARDALGANVVDDVLARGGRIVQVNVWRPIKGPVQRAPLALADARSIAPDELIATDQRFPDRTGEIYQLAYAEHQRWFYAPEMEVDEVLLIKGWDSLDDGRARFTPHGAFVLAGSEDRPPRESIETRTYLVFEPR
ncbi:MAG: methyltransferase [Gammaproteobacteria bacterium]|nr:methyltransferase [Gammaproteobacteria bacterium]